MERLAIYCAEVGSVKQGHFGWARVDVRRRRRTGPGHMYQPALVENPELERARFVQGFMPTQARPESTYSRG